MCLPEVILEGIVLVYGCIGVRTQVKVYSFTDAPIHLYIGTLHSCITYGYMKLGCTGFLLKMCLPEVILDGIVLVYRCIGVHTQVKVYSFTDASIHLYIGTLHSCITYGYMKRSTIISTVR